MPSRKPPTTNKSGELAAQLAALKLTRTAEDLDDFLARATKRRWGPRVVLEELARDLFGLSPLSHGPDSPEARRGGGRR